MSSEDLIRACAPRDLGFGISIEQPSCPLAGTLEVVIAVDEIKLVSPIITFTLKFEDRSHNVTQHSSKLGAVSLPPSATARGRQT